MTETANAEGEEDRIAAATTLASWFLMRLFRRWLSRLFHSTGLTANAIIPGKYVNVSYETATAMLSPKPLSHYAISSTLLVGHYSHGGKYTMALVGQPQVALSRRPVLADRAG
jgi:hypothetical protein